VIEAGKHRGSGDRSTAHRDDRAEVGEAAEAREGQQSGLLHRWRVGAAALLASRTTDFKALESRRLGDCSVRVWAKSGRWGVHTVHRVHTVSPLLVSVDIYPSFRLTFVINLINSPKT
jgi:hypothetical protein